MNEPIEFDETGRVKSIGGGPPPKPKDQRVAYGATCTWWDDISKVGKMPPSNGHSLPCCPRCGGVLFEVPNEAEWFAGADQYERDGHPGYRAKLEWSRGKCFPNQDAMDKAFSNRPER